MQERLRLDALLFGESPSRIVISVKKEHLSDVRQCIQDMGAKVPMSLLGHVTDTDQMEVSVNRDPDQKECQLSWNVTDLAERWQNSLVRQLGITPS